MERFRRDRRPLTSCQNCDGGCQTFAEIITKFLNLEAPSGIEMHVERSAACPGVSQGKCFTRGSHATQNSSSRLQCGAQQNNNNNFGALLGAAPLGSEKAVELNYSLQVTPFWYVQPVFQYYVDVGANGALPNAAVFGFRTKVNF